MELGIRFRVLLPASVGCMHLVLTVVAEVQRKTGWGYIPPGVAIDPSPLPIAEQLAIWLNLPAYIITLAISILTRFPTEGTSLLLLETPFVVLFWIPIANWIDKRRRRALVEPLVL
jgi:hypothetical protein